jgi:hypothetical protein
MRILKALESLYDRVSCQIFEHLSKSIFWLVHLLLLEVKPPRWLGIANKHSKLWVAITSLCGVRSCPQKRKGHLAESSKVVESNTARVYPRSGHSWLPQRRCMIQVGI